MTKQPAYIAYSVVDEQDTGKSRWREIGVAFRNLGHDDSFTVLLDAAPLSGKLVLLPPKERATTEPSA